MFPGDSPALNGGVNGTDDVPDLQSDGRDQAHEHLHLPLAMVDNEMVVITEEPIVVSDDENVINATKCTGGKRGAMLSVVRDSFLGKKRDANMKMQKIVMF